MIENVRPLFASNNLVWLMFDKHDLVDGSNVLERIARLARRNDVETIDLALEWPAATAERAQAELVDGIRAVTLEYELECFENVLADTRPAIDLVIRRANAWAERLTDQAAGELVLQMRKAWLAEAESALQQNSFSFAILGVAELLRSDDDSFLGMLAEKGYSVERPL